MVAFAGKVCRGVTGHHHLFAGRSMKRRACSSKPKMTSTMLMNCTAHRRTLRLRAGRCIRWNRSTCASASSCSLVPRRPFRHHHTTGACQLCQMRQCYQPRANAMRCNVSIHSLCCVCHLEAWRWSPQVQRLSSNYRLAPIAKRQHRNSTFKHRLHASHQLLWRQFGSWWQRGTSDHKAYTAANQQPQQAACMG